MLVIYDSDVGYMKIMIVWLRYKKKINEKLTQKYAR